MLRLVLAFFFFFFHQFFYWVLARALLGQALIFDPQQTLVAGGAERGGRRTAVSHLG